MVAASQYLIALTLMLQGLSSRWGEPFLLLLHHYKEEDKL